MESKFISQLQGQDSFLGWWKETPWGLEEVLVPVCTSCDTWSSRLFPRPCIDVRQTGGRQMVIRISYQPVHSILNNNWRYLANILASNPKMDITRRGLNILYWPPPPMCLPSVYLTSPHMTGSPRPSPSVFAYCKWSNTGGGNSLGTRLECVVLVFGITSCCWQNSWFVCPKVCLWAAPLVIPQSSPFFFSQQTSTYTCGKTTHLCRVNRAFWITLGQTGTSNTLQLKACKQTRTWTNICWVA